MVQFDEVRRIGQANGYPLSFIDVRQTSVCWTGDTNNDEEIIGVVIQLIDRTCLLSVTADDIRSKFSILSFPPPQSISSLDTIFYHAIIGLWLVFENLRRKFAGG